MAARAAPKQMMLQYPTLAPKARRILSVHWKNQEATLWMRVLQVLHLQLFQGSTPLEGTVGGQRRRRVRRRKEKG